MTGDSGQIETKLEEVLFVRRKDDEKGIWFLLLRAILVVAVVLAALTVLRHFGVTVRERDVPAFVVEQTVTASAVFSVFQ